ncbi:citrate synthase family protein [Massilia endophytica]|uniref:citryl-CoA lyase n=1 Tax=Massilia endophytica TaxID=2899220 RepID=UPI001E39D84E|nr:citryl-CoA lyase [Massilia endophytica]UGQ48688.1 citryl-CoA lyase [Massilia endophytica]
MAKDAPAPSPRDLIHTAIWREEAEDDNAFAARAAFCRGYDVFGAMVGNARWVEMLWLLLRQELPPPAALDTLEALAVALANPGPRDPSVHAAMCGAVGGSTAAASLIAALSVGAGRVGGAREVHDAMTMWQQCGADLAAWRIWSVPAPDATIEVWPARGHVPGFDPHGVSTPLAVRQLLAAALHKGAGERTVWLLANLDAAQETIGLPLAIGGAAAAILSDLGFTPQEGEMLYLLLRLPGAAAHALEQSAGGFKQFPFYSVELQEAA